jgi:cysteine sulfinate desulfinase/cysteine desulfurase-like protein
MKSTIILFLLAINGLLISTGSAANAANLSQSISTLANIDPDNYELVNAAIARALAAKQQKVEIQQHTKHTQFVTDDTREIGLIQRSVVPATISESPR